LIASPDPLFQQKGKSKNYETYIPTAPQTQKISSWFP